MTKALQYLNQTQQPDGTWPGGPSMTALAVLAYFGQGEALLSREFGEPCFKGVTALIDLAAKNDGLFSGKPPDNTYGYQHGIVTHALAEAAVWTQVFRVDIPNLYPTVQRAGQYIIDHQHPSGGWNSGFTKTRDGDADLRVTAWQVMALRACALTKLEFRELVPCVKRALEFIGSLHQESGAFVHRPNAPADETNLTLTGAGILCFQIWKKGSGSEPRHAAKRLLETARFDYNGESADLYGHLFQSQAMINYGGGWWEHYRASTLKPLLDNQNPDGSWKVPGGGGRFRTLAPEVMTNAHQRTCLCVLMLEVYYQFLTTIPRIRPEGYEPKPSTPPRENPGDGKPPAPAPAPPK